MIISIKKERIGLLLILIVISMTIISYIFIVKPDLVKVNKLKLKKEAREEKLTKLKKRNFELLPIKMKTNQFLEQIERLMQSTNIKLISFTPQQKFNNEQYSKLSITILFSGSYKGVVKFIQYLDKLDRLITIDDLQIVSSNKDVLKVTSLISIYSLREEE